MDNYSIAITVENIRPINNAGSLRASADLRVNGWLMKNFRVVQQDGQRPWVSVPQVEYRTREGKRAFSNILEPPDDVKPLIQAAVLEAYDRMISDRSGGTAW